MSSKKRTPPKRSPRVQAMQKALHLLEQNGIRGSQIDHEEPADSGCR